MSWTKRQFVEAAFEEIGYAVYEFDVGPEQLQKALWRMDSMLATWNGKGIRIGYPIPTSPENSDLDTETNVPDKANEAIYTNLAIKIAPTIGKVVSRETKVAAKHSFDALLAAVVKPEPMQLPSNMPAGAGNKKETVDDRPFSAAPDNPVAAGDDAVFDFE